MWSSWCREITIRAWGVKELTLMDWQCYHSPHLLLPLAVLPLSPYYYHWQHYHSPLDGITQGGVAILMVASCWGNWEMLPLDGLLSITADFQLT